MTPLENFLCGVNLGWCALSLIFLCYQIIALARILWRGTNCD